jgi:hypothetical protein
MAFTSASDIDARNAQAAKQASAKALRDKVEQMINTRESITSIRGVFDDSLRAEVIQEAYDAGWTLTLTPMGRGNGELSIQLSRR